MKNETSAARATRISFILRQADQACCAVLIGLALGAIAVCWIYQGGLSGRLIDVDKADRQSIHFRIDMNEAEWPEWALLPGVGETLARRIVESRANEGPFRRPEELLRVRGIGAKTLERIRPYLATHRVEGVSDALSRDEGDTFPKGKPLE